MRIVDFETSRLLSDVAMYLTPEEIEDLRAYLNRLSETPSIQKVYLSEVVDHGIGREVTIAIDASRIAA